MTIIYAWKTLASFFEGGEALWLQTDTDIRVRFPEEVSINSINSALEDKEISVGELLNCKPTHWEGELMAYFSHPKPLAIETSASSNLSLEKITMDQKIETTIIDLLRAQEPATLGQICSELITQQEIKATEVLPIAISAIAAMQEKGLICEYEQMPFTNPMEYAWVLAD